jgi:ABC-type antimicrobial peptide transport system permease subunit
VCLALGATPARLVRGVIGQTLRLAGVGIAIGAVVAIGAGRLAAGLVSGVPPYDLAALAIAEIGFTAVAVVAALLPSRRVVRLDPVQALRAD